MARYDDIIEYSTRKFLEAESPEDASKWMAMIEKASAAKVKEADEVGKAEMVRAQARVEQAEHMAGIAEKTSKVPLITAGLNLLSHLIDGGSQLMSVRELRRIEEDDIVPKNTFALIKKH